MRQMPASSAKDYCSVVDQMKNSRKHPRHFRSNESVQKASDDLEPYIFGGPGTAPATKKGVAIEADLFLQPLIRRSMFWSPAYLDGDWNEYVPLAFWLVDMLRPQLVVEAGHVSPVSYFALCQAAQRLELDTQCVAIDGGSEQVDFVRTYSAQHYHAFSAVVSQSVEEASHGFDAGAIDLLHLNLSSVTASHSNRYIENWLGRITPGGVVLISGTSIQSNNTWLKDELAKLKQDYSVFEFTHGIGVSLVSIARDLPAPLATLFDAGASSGGRTSGVRELFARLGKGCADAHALSVLQANGAMSAKAAATHKNNKSTNNAEKEKIAALTAEIDDMRRQALVMEDELLHSRQAVSGHTSKINTLGTELKLADALKERQTQEIVTLTKLVLHTEEKLADLQAELAEKTSLVTNGEPAASVVVSTKKHGRLPGLLRVFGSNSRGRDKGKSGVKFLQAQKLLLSSALFDEKWYLDQYRDVAATGLTPVEHYLTIGAERRYNPSANFDTSYYLNTYQDVAASGMNPLVHYLRFGISENRKAKAN